MCLFAWLFRDDNKISSGWPVAYLSAEKVMQGKFGSEWQPGHCGLDFMHSSQMGVINSPCRQNFSHAAQLPLFLWDKAIPWPNSTQSEPLLILLLSSRSLSSCLSFVSVCSPSVRSEDKIPSSLFLSSPSDKLQISHHCQERLPSPLMLEALFFSLLMKYELFPPGSLDLYFQYLHLTVFNLMLEFRFFFYSLCVCNKVSK